MDEQTGVYKFLSIGEMAETTTQLLSLSLQYKTSFGGQSRPQRKSGLEQMEQLILQQARDYLAEVREGFVLSAQTTKVRNRAELQFLLERVLVDWGELSRELGLEEREPAEGQPIELECIRQQLVAYGMAVVALGQLPRLPAEHVTFPYSYSTPPTYSDIPTPDTAGEMLWRIEELEQMIWQLMSNDLQALVERRYGALRRTYGFFETSALLANREAERFGLKKKSRPLKMF